MWVSDKLGFVLAPALIVIKNRALGGSREQNNGSIVSFIRKKQRARRMKTEGKWRNQEEKNTRTGACLSCRG